MQLFTFKPLSDNEIQTKTLLPAGEYEFNVTNAEQLVSKSGNNMIKLTLSIYVDNHIRTVFDYLVSSESSIRKIKQFCDTCGLQKKYAEGSLTEDDCVNKSGIVKIVIRKGADKGDGSYYDDSNSVKEYTSKHIDRSSDHGFLGNTARDTVFEKITF